MPLAFKKLLLIVAVMLHKSEEEKENLLVDEQVPRRWIILKCVLLEHVQWFVSKVFGSV